MTKDEITFRDKELDVRVDLKTVQRHNSVQICWETILLVDYDITAMFPKQCSVSQVFNIDEDSLNWK